MSISFCHAIRDGSCGVETLTLYRSSDGLHSFRIVLRSLPWGGCSSRCRKAWPDFIIQSFQRSVDFLVDVLDHGSTGRVGRAGGVAFDVVEERLIVPAIRFEGGAEMPH